MASSSSLPSLLTSSLEASAAISWTRYMVELKLKLVISFSILLLLLHTRLSQETLLVEVVLGMMSAFHAHKWVLQAASYLLCFFSHFLLSIFSYSPFPVITAVGLCFLFIGICRLQDEEIVNGAVHNGKRDSVDSEVDVEEAEESSGDGSPMEKDSSTKTEEEKVDQKDKDEERDVFIAALLDQLVATAAKDELSFKRSLGLMAMNSKTEAEL